MTGVKRKTDRDILRDCWCRWTAILSLFARRRQARRRLDPHAYAALRKELVAACRSLAEADGPNRPFYAGLEETIKPWLDLRVLERTDPEILSQLLLHCREVDRKLKGRKWGPALSRHWGPTMAIVAGGAVIGGLVSLFPMGSLSVLNTVLDAVNMTWLTIKYADDWHKACAFAVIVIVTAMHIVSRTARA